MSKAQELKAKYVADADMMASKSRFGFFTLPPSHTAGVTDFANNTSTLFAIQLIGMPMVRSSPNLQTSIAVLLPNPACRKTTFHTHLRPSMVPNTKILESTNESSKQLRHKDKKEKINSDLSSSTKLCMLSLI
jgi:hypothetical protein